MRGLLIVVLALTAVPAMAQTLPACRANQPLASLDRNGDGRIDVAEYAASRLETMAAADHDGRPGLSVDEFRLGLEDAARPTAAASFAAFDANNDQVLDDLEIGAYEAFVFNTVLDLDHDGTWTLAEYRALAVFRQARRAGGSDRAAVISTLDQNQNGGVDLAEFLAAQSYRFLQFDADCNNQLSEPEYRASLDRGARQQATANLNTFDNDRDHALSHGEFMNFHSFIFRTVLDRDRDGVWTVDEFRALQRAR